LRPARGKTVSYCSALGTPNIPVFGVFRPSGRDASVVDDDVRERRRIEDDYRIDRFNRVGIPPFRLLRIRQVEARGEFPVRHVCQRPGRCEPLRRRVKSDIERRIVNRHELLENGKISFGIVGRRQQRAQHARLGEDQRLAALPIAAQSR
jgi:hypothetical protein